MAMLNKFAFNLLNQILSQDVTGSTVSYNFSLEIIACRYSNFSNTRPNNSVIANGKSKVITQTVDRGTIEFQPFRFPHRSVSFQYHGYI